MNRSFLRIRARTWIAAVAVVALLGGVSMMWGVGDHALAQGPAMTAKSSAAEAGTSYARTLSKAFREAAQKVLPSVVMIQTTPKVNEKAVAENESSNNGNEENPFGDMLPPEFRRFFKDMPQTPGHGFHMMPSPEVSGIGSGVIIDSSGIILTNNHVVDGGGNIMVRLHDGRELKGSQIVSVKTDPKTDLAIIRVKADNLQAAKLGNSDDMQVGDWVLALGDPFGLEGTVTAGIISAKGRGIGIAPRENFIQTDAAINPGNSGGPLVNLDGEVIGIDTAISSRSGGNQGVGFAVSSNLAKWVSDQLIAHGSVQRSYLGVAIQPVTQDLAQQFGIQSREGAVVTDVQPNAPAAAAGLKTGDVIVEFAGKRVTSPQELQMAVEQAKIGESQPVTVVRDGKQLTLQVTTREQPENYGTAQFESRTPGKEGSVHDQKLGVDVTNLTPNVAEKLGIKEGEGVVITDVQRGSLAGMAGLGSGMVIVSVDRKPVKSVADFQKIMENQSVDKGVLLLVRSERGTRFVVIRSGG